MKALADTLTAGRSELVSYARREVGADAEEVVQEATVRALEKQHQLADPAAARAWLFSIVRRVVMERSRRRQPAPVEAGLLAQDADPGCVCVLKQLESLPPAQATLLSRVVVDGVAVDALAAELGITRNTAWVRLHRAREALRGRLKAHCGTESLRQCLDCGCLERGCCR